MMMRYGKWAAIAFAAWFLITQPAQAADLIKQAGSTLATAADSLATFISELP